MRSSSKETVARAKSLRCEMSLPEVLLRQALRRRSTGYKFRHQHSVGHYALDFCCASAALCVEVDGMAHDMGSNPQRDAQRDARLAELGIRTLRIPAEEILRDTEAVLTLIKQECAARSPSTGFAGPPPPESRGRISGKQS